MKTFKSVKRMLIALLLMTSANASADVLVNGIYYYLKTTYAGVSVAPSTNPYSGDIVIPSEITYEGVTYPVTSIGSKAFLACSGMTSVEIPNSITYIADYAFSKCTGLTSITIPSSVTSLNWSAFSDCSGLLSINVEEGNARYDSRNNCNAIIETESNSLIQGCNNTVIPSDITYINGAAFRGCKGLTSITIPGGVSLIGSETFYGCSGLASVSISDNMRQIGNYAFWGCKALKSIIFPKSLDYIGEKVFGGCTVLKDIYFEGLPSTLASQSFPSSLENIYVPIGYRDMFRSTWTNSDITLYTEILNENSAEDIVIPATETGVKVNLIRTLSDAYWNTVCIPFALTEEQVKNTFGEGTRISSYTGVTEGDIMLFKHETAIEAGVPYLIKPSKTVVNPKFDVVDITAQTAMAVGMDYQFVGVYGAKPLKTDGTNLFVAKDGNLNIPIAGGETIYGMRAYVAIPNGSSAKTISLDFGEGEITGINILNCGQTNGGIYNLSGQYVGTSMDKLDKGVYITSGKKVIKNKN